MYQISVIFSDGIFPQRAIVSIVMNIFTYYYAATAGDLIFIKKCPHNTVGKSPELNAVQTHTSSVIYPECATSG